MAKTLASSILIYAFAIALPLAAATSWAAPLNAGAAVAVGASGDSIAERIGGAFASRSQTNVEWLGADAVTLSPKGDRQRTSDCAGATWRNIDASCLMTAAGSPAPHVRTITVGYQTGANTTLLLRFPPQR
jgi:hypothetical protein